MGNLRVRIISTPPGDAPLWVREKWVGIELPTARCTGPAVAVGFGVFSKNAWSFWRRLIGLFSGEGELVKGYVVNALTAVQLLEQVSPKAADWWRQSTPRALTSKDNFMFHAEACEEIH